MATATVVRGVTVDCRDGVTLRGDLALPDPMSRRRTHGLVVFAHGSGASRLNPRNREVVRVLQDQRLATLLVDLLTAEEDQWAAQSSARRFDIDLLASRFGEALRHIRDGGLDTPDSTGAKTSVTQLPLAIFGAGTAAAAGLRTAARHPEQVKAVVCRGRRLDLAADDFPALRVPVLLFAGERDRDTLDAARRAATAIGERATVDVIPGASRLFDEPHALDAMSARAARWLTTALDPVAVSQQGSG
jgi:putative phosphoribosyl transferase